MTKIIVNTELKMLLKNVKINPLKVNASTKNRKKWCINTRMIAYFMNQGSPIVCTRGDVVVSSTSRGEIRLMM